MLRWTYSVGPCVIPCAFFGKSVKHMFSCRKMYSWKSDVSTITENSVIVKAQIARPLSPHSREYTVQYNFLKLYYIRCKMSYVSSLTYI